MTEPKRIELGQTAGGVDYIDIAPTKLSGVLIRVAGWDPCEFYVTPEQASAIAVALSDAAWACRDAERPLPPGARRPDAKKP